MKIPTMRSNCHEPDGTHTRSLLARRLPKAGQEPCFKAQAVDMRSAPHRSYVAHLVLTGRPPAGWHLLRPVVAAATLDRVQHALALALAGRVAALDVSVRRSHLADKEAEAV